MSTLTAPPGRGPHRGCPQAAPPLLAAAGHRGGRIDPQQVFVLAPTRTRTRDTGRGALSSTAGQKSARRLTRKQVQAQNSITYWVGQMADAEAGTDALNQMWSWTLGALRGLSDKRPDAAEAARYHLARQLALFAAQLPDASIPLRAGLTEAEEAQLFDPWDKRNGAGQ